MKCHDSTSGLSNINTVSHIHYAAEMSYIISSAYLLEFSGFLNLHRGHLLVAKQHFPSVSI